MRAAVLFASLVVSSSASAESYYPEPLPQQPAPRPVQEPVLAPPSTVAPLIVQQPPAYTMLDPDLGPKSSGTAMMLSLTATIAPPLLASIAYGNDSEAGGDDHDELLLWVLGTSALFGPSVGQWYAGKAITPGLGVRAVGFALGAAAFGTDDLDEAVGLLMLGSTCIIGGAIYDIATAGRSAREYNFEHATRTMPMVAPTIAPDGSAQLRVGVSGAF